MTKKIKIDSVLTKNYHPSPRMTIMATNYLDTLADDILEIIYKQMMQMSSDEIELQIKHLESNLSNCFFKRVRANKLTEHLIMDSFFHINPKIDVDLMVSGPVLVQFADLFANPWKNTEDMDTTSLTISGDNTIKDILVKAVKHLGRHKITKWHDGVTYNCIQDIQIDDEAEDSEDEDTPASDVKSFMIITFSNNINGVGFKNKKFPKKYGLVKII